MRETRFSRASDDATSSVCCNLWKASAPSSCVRSRMCPSKPARRAHPGAATARGADPPDAADGRAATITTLSRRHHHQ